MAFLKRVLFWVLLFLLLLQDFGNAIKRYGKILPSSNNNLSTIKNTQKYTTNFNSMYQSDYEAIKKTPTIDSRSLSGTGEPTTPSNDSLNTAESIKTRKPRETNPPFLIGDPEKPCITAQMSLTISLPYVKKDGTKAVASLTLPELPDAEIELIGACEGGTVAIGYFQGPVVVYMWAWKGNYPINNNNFVAVTFEVEGETKKLEKIKLSVSTNSAVVFPDAAEPTGTLMEVDFKISNPPTVQGNGVQSACGQTATGLDSTTGASVQMFDVVFQVGDGIPNYFIDCHKGEAAAVTITTITLAICFSLTTTIN